VNVIQEAGPQVQIRGVLKCTAKGVKNRRIVTEMVDWSACNAVEDGLTRHDDIIPAEAVQRVEFHREARNQSDYLEETVVEMMLKWGLFGPTATQGLMPCVKRFWVASVWEYTHLLREWKTVKEVRTTRNT
jgi:hypothetical protein